MRSELLAAIVDAIRNGAFAKDSPLSLLEFQAINDARLERDKAIRNQFLKAIRKGTVRVFKGG